MIWWKDEKFDVGVVIAWVVHGHLERINFLERTEKFKIQPRVNLPHPVRSIPFSQDHVSQSDFLFM